MSGAENAELIFCPYNYLLDPVIRRAVQIDLEDAVIILDEAHNIEDICRYFLKSLSRKILYRLQMRLSMLTHPACEMDRIAHRKGGYTILHNHAITLECSFFIHLCWRCY